MSGPTYDLFLALSCGILTLGLGDLGIGELFGDQGSSPEVSREVPSAIAVLLCPRLLVDQRCGHLFRVRTARSQTLNTEENPPPLVKHPRCFDEYEEPSYHLCKHSCCLLGLGDHRILRAISQLDRHLSQDQRGNVRERVLIDVRTRVISTTLIGTLSDGLVSYAVENKLRTTARSMSVLVSPPRSYSHVQNCSDTVRSRASYSQSSG